MLTCGFLRYTFRDVITSRFRARLPHTAYTALVTPALHINQQEQAPLGEGASK